MFKKIFNKFSPKRKSQILHILCIIYNKVQLNKKNINGNGNIIDINRALCKKISIRIIGDNNRVIFKSGSRITNTDVSVSGSNHELIIDEFCIIQGCSFAFEDSNCSIIIGKNTTMENYCELSSAEPFSKIIVGDDCMFSVYVIIRTTDSHSIIDCKSKMRINPAKDVIIGNHVWLGIYTIVLKGVSIGDDCVIGARSIVTKSFPSNTLIAGSPATTIHESITWTRQRV